MKLVSVYDSKAQAHLNVSVTRTSAEAIRQFESACKNKESSFNQYPQDFILKEIGVWDEITGLLSPLDAPIILATASEFVQ